MSLWDLFGSGARGELIESDVRIAAPPLSPENYRTLVRQALQDVKAAALHQDLVGRRLRDLREQGLNRKELRRLLTEEEQGAGEATGPTPARSRRW
jgi:hypothetical protein